MSLAENLLNDLPETEQSIEEMSAEEPHIIVGADRKITVPAQLKEIAVTGDKNIETVTFDCVRYWDGHDLSTFAIYLNYTLPNGAEATYIPTDISRSDEYYSFDWTIDSNMTEESGNLKISIVAVLTDEEGNKTKQWGSYPNSDLSIVKGLDVANVPDVTDQPDILSQILSELNGKVSVDDMENYELSIVKKGTAENSAVLDGKYQGYSNEAISQASVSLGAANVSGLKGWYYKYVDYTNKQIYLSATQPTIQNILKPSADSSFVSGYAVGDVLSFVAGSSYENRSTISAIEGNKITVDLIPFTSTPTRSGGSPTEYSVYCTEKYDLGGCDLGQGSFAEGVRTGAVNVGAHSEGVKSTAYGQASHAEGFQTEAGNSAHSEGRNTHANGQSSHAEGYSTSATGVSSHAEGDGTESIGQASHTEGMKTVAEQIGSHAEGGLTHANSEWSHAEGYNTVADAVCSHTEGNGSVASGTNSHAEGSHSYAEGTASHAEGYQSVAYGLASHAEGVNGWARNDGAHAEGSFCEASGGSSHAEGSGNKATNTAAHAEGGATVASGVGSHAEGGGSNATGDWSHVEGYSCNADGNSSHAEGQRTRASGTASHAGGIGTEATAEAQTVIGKYNYTDDIMAFIVGAGMQTEMDTYRKNAFAVDWGGNIHLNYGNGGGHAAIFMASPNGTRYKITVNDNGELSAVLADYD